jgi:hypothetical protein
MRMRALTKIAALLALSALAIVVVSGGCAGRRPAERAQWIETTFQAPDLLMPPVRLRIPRGYLNDLVGWWEPKLPQPTRTPLTEPQKILLLWATWPEMGPKTQDNRKRFDQPRQLTLAIAMEAIPFNVIPGINQTTDPREFMTVRKALSEEFVKAGLKADLVEHTPRFGLRVRGVPLAFWGTPGPGSSPREDFGQVMTPLDDRSETPSTVIWCHFELLKEPEEAPDSGRIPHCSHYFPMPEIDAEVKVHYRRNQLAQWREIEERTRTLLRSFIVDHKQ